MSVHSKVLVPAVLTPEEVADIIEKTEFSDGLDVGVANIRQRKIDDFGTPSSYCCIELNVTYRGEEQRRRMSVFSYLAPGAADYAEYTTGVCTDISLGHDEMGETVIKNIAQKIGGRYYSSDFREEFQDFPLNPEVLDNQARAMAVHSIAVQKLKAFFESNQGFIGEAERSRLMETIDDNPFVHAAVNSMLEIEARTPAPAPAQPHDDSHGTFTLDL